MAIITLILASVIVLIDQLSKIWAYNNLSQVGQIKGIPGILDFMYVENTGAAFGILPNQNWLFIILAMLVLVVALYVLFKKKIKSKLFLASMALMIGGAVGNMIDRIIRGFVIDFLKLSFFPPVCNFADYCLTVGAVLLLVYILFLYSIAEKNDERLKQKTEFNQKKL